MFKLFNISKLSKLSNKLSNTINTTNTINFPVQANVISTPEINCSRSELLKVCNSLLEPSRFKDYCPNGLQVEGTAVISRIALAVTANQAAIDAAIEWGAHALITHHGLIWKGEDGTITGFRYARLKSIMAANLNILAYHLPLDAHATVGNNAQIASRLGILNAAPLDKEGIVWAGDLSEELGTPEALFDIVNTQLKPPGTAIFVANEAATNKPLGRIAWCTGGGGSYLEQAIAAGVDVFLTGEANEQHVHIARESGIALVLAGHHATERYGIQALGAALSNTLGITVKYFEIDSPL